MQNGVQEIEKILHQSWETFIKHLPSILMAIAVFLIGTYLIRKFSKLSFKYIDKNSDDPLASDFIVNIISFVLTLLLIVICLSILGYGDLTDKILAGAGVGTVVVGIAMQDIAKNFLSGIFMAYRRPFQVGDLIEISNIKGRVATLSLRETTIVTLDGKEVYIPNGLITNDALINWTKENLLREEFTITVVASNEIDLLLRNITNSIQKIDEVQKDKAPLAYIEDVGVGTFNIKVMYWYAPNSLSINYHVLKSNVINDVYKAIIGKGYSLPNGVTEVKMVN